MVKKTEKKKYKAVHTGIGLIFPITRTTRLMRQIDSSHRYSQQSGVSMAACLEYVVKEILDLAIEHCKEKGRRRIKADDIKEGIKKDMEMKDFFEKELKTIISI